MTTTKFTRRRMISSGQWWYPPARHSTRPQRRDLGSLRDRRGSEAHRLGDACPGASQRILEGGVFLGRCVVEDRDTAAARVDQPRLQCCTREHGGADGGENGEEGGGRSRRVSRETRSGCHPRTLWHLCTHTGAERRVCVDARYLMERLETAMTVVVHSLVRFALSVRSFHSSFRTSNPSLTAGICAAHISATHILEFRGWIAPALSTASSLYARSNSTSC